MHTTPNPINLPSAAATASLKPATAAPEERRPTSTKEGAKPSTPVKAPIKPDEVNAHGARVVPLEQIKPSPFNPRRDFSEIELDELANSIQEKGLIQPIVVRPAPKGPGYEIVAGERRWRAAQKAGLRNVPVVVKELQDQEVLELAIIENVQRTDLNALEEAAGYKELVDSHGYSQEKLARVIGKSRAHLSNMLRLLKLPEKIQNMLREGAISAGHGRALIGQPNAEKLADMIVEKGMSVRQIEAYIQQQNAARNTDDDIMMVHDTDGLMMEKEMSDALGLAVNIRKGKGQSGELRLKYKTLDQFDELYSRLMMSKRS